MSTVKKRLSEAIELGHMFESKFKEKTFYDENDKKNSLPPPRIMKKVTSANIGDEDGVYSIAVHPKHHKAAVGLGSGALHVYNHDTNKLTCLRKLRESLKVSLPIMAVKFHPCDSTNLLYSASSTGLVQVWNLDSYSVASTIEEPDNQLTSLDLTGDGRSFATAGKDCCVRIYDSEALAVTRTFSGSRNLDVQNMGNEAMIPGHSQKIFSLKYHPYDQNVLLTASWDHSVKVWDMRCETAVKGIHGPYVCGDGLDVNHTSILTASWRPQQALEVWDYRMGSFLCSLTYPICGTSKGEYLYCARWWDDDHVVAGGSGNNDLKMINISLDRVVEVVSETHPVQAVEVKTVGQQMILLGTSGNVFKKIQISE